MFPKWGSGWPREVAEEVENIQIGRSWPATKEDQGRPQRLKFSTRREATGDGPQTPLRGSPKMAPKAISSAGSEHSIPHPAPTRRKLESLEPGNCPLGVGPSGRGAPGRNSRSGDPGGPGRTIESPGQGPAAGARRVRARPALAGAPPPPPAGLPRVLPRAHTHHTQAPRPGPGLPGGRGPPGGLGQGPVPRPPQRPLRRPGPASRARETLHSPEFLHVCGRGLRETKR